MAGWIKLYRDITDHWIWQEKPFDKRSAWIDLILMANHKDNKFVFGNELTEVKRGSFITSVRKLCNKWGWSNTKVTSFLQILKNDNMIDFLSDTKKTVVTIVNYGLYQDINDTKTTQKRHENDTETTQKHTNKNVKNDKNDKKLKDIADKPQTQKFIPPTLEEIKEYCFERNNNVDAERFMNFYQAKGWMVGKNKMKDWKASVRTWEQKQKEYEPQQKVSNGNVFLELLKGRNGTNDNG
jgi:hypothetical protein